MCNYSEVTRVVAKGWLKSGTFVTSVLRESVLSKQLFLITLSLMTLNCYNLLMLFHLPYRGCLRKRFVSPLWLTRGSRCSRRLYGHFVITPACRLVSALLHQSPHRGSSCWGVWVGRAVWGSSPAAEAPKSGRKDIQMLTGPTFTSVCSLRGWPLFFLADILHVLLEL